MKGKREMTKAIDIVLTKQEAEQIIQALSARASDEMRYRAWEVLDSAMKLAAYMSADMRFECSAEDMANREERARLTGKDGY
jgi:hypothetical protein